MARDRSSSTRTSPASKENGRGNDGERCEHDVVNWRHYGRAENIEGLDTIKTLIK